MAAGTAGGSSISDTDPYRSICRQAASDPEVFRTFKRDPRYQLVLEHVTPQQGAVYLTALFERSPAFAGQFERFRANDRLGNPVVHDFGPGIGVFSPTTCRYMKVLSDLLMMFGDLSGMRIVEVGGGYGGQSFVIHAACKPASYTIIDLPEAEALQARYLEALEIPGVSFLTMDALPAHMDCDLFISNYAITECARAITDSYLDVVVKTAARGYVSGNRIGHACYSRAEWMQLLPQCIATEEFPRTAEDNYLLLWKTAREPARPHPLVT